MMKPPASLIPPAILLCAASATAQESPESIDLYAMMEQVADDIGREIVVDPGIATMRVSTGQGEFQYTSRPPAYSTEDDIDYESFLAMLRATGLVAVETADQIMVMPEESARAAPSRLLQEDDSTVSDHEFVTRILNVPDGFSAAQLVPVLRPMMPQSAQMGAVPDTNSLVLVDRYDNIRRITAVIDEIVGGL